MKGTNMTKEIDETGAKRARRQLNTDGVPRRVVSFRFRPSLLARADKFARAHSLTRSGLSELALEDYINKGGKS